MNSPYANIFLILFISDSLEQNSIYNLANNLVTITKLDSNKNKFMVIY